MSRPHYAWWGYAKDVIRRYPSMRGKHLAGVAKREHDAVQAAIEQTQRMRGGHERLKIVDLVFWQCTHDLSGAALQVPCSERTAQQWHADFIKAVARNFGLLD